MKKMLKIVFVIIASFVGAGFASGKEIYEFFYIYGSKGIIGIVISSTIISFTIYKVIQICSKNKIANYSKFCEYIVNNHKELSLILNKIINIFLLVTFFIMISGFSSLLNQEFNINKIIGAIIIVVLIFLILTKNVNGLIKISNYLIPLFVLFILVMMVKNSNYLNIIRSKKTLINTHFTIYNNWFVKSILYGSYNCAVLIPVIVLISPKIKTRKEVLRVCISIFFLIAILSLSIFNLLILGDSKISNLEMPVISIMQKYSNTYKITYSFLIGISIFTTAISTGLSFLSNVSKNKNVYIRNLIIISLIGFLVSQISFGTLVKMLYPALGVIGFGELILILWPNLIKQKTTIKRKHTSCKITKKLV